MLSNLVSFLLIAIAAANGTDVLKLTDKNFDTLLAEKPLVLVNFHTAKYVTRFSPQIEHERPCPAQLSG